MDVTLVPVGEQILRDLLGVATEEATADEVTPPLTPRPAWTEARRQWFMDYHRAVGEQFVEAAMNRAASITPVRRHRTGARDRGAAE